MNTLISFNIDQSLVNRNIRKHGTNGVGKFLLEKVRDFQKQPPEVFYEKRWS